MTCPIPVGEDACNREPWNTGRLCADHQGRLLRAVRSIPEHARTITVLLGYTTAASADKVSGSREQPLPAASTLVLTGPESEATHFADPFAHSGPTVLAQVGSWALLVQEERNLFREDYPTSLHGLSLACQTLVRNMDWITAQDWVPDAYDELTTIARNVRLAAGDHPQPQRGKVPCPVCKMRALWQSEPSTPQEDEDGQPVVKNGKIVLLGGDYQCLPRLGGCNARVSELDHDLLTEAMGTGFIQHDERLSA